MLLQSKPHSCKLLFRTFVGFCAASLCFFHSIPSSAASIKEQNIAANKAVLVESNQVENWPTGPIVSAESAILMEAHTGAILYAKNIHEQQYPASITKILTTLIASERCSMDELVTFSYDATHDIDPGSNHIAIDAGEKLTVEECLNAILIRSANEVSLGIAEHIAQGPWEDFAAVMNERAKELGCLNSNFVNPNGLPNKEHVTTAYDMAMIGKAFFANETLCKMTLTPMLKINPSAYQPDTISEVNKMELIPRGDYAYENLIGCKTGYTNDARSTLVSCAEKDGMKLICVVLKDESPYQYEDTIALFEYGFNNFAKVNISQTETKYNIGSSDSFYSDNNIFGNTQPFLSLNKSDCIILPQTIDFADTISTISYDTAQENQAAVITYSYQNVVLGNVSVDLAVSQDSGYVFDAPEESQEESSVGSQDPSANADATTKNDEKETSFIFINIVKVLAWIVGILSGVIIVFFLIIFLRNYLSHRRRHRSSSSGRSKRRTVSPYGRNRNLSMESSFNARRKEQIRQARRRRRVKRPNRFRDYDF